MTTIIGVRFKKTGKLYYFNPCGMQIEVGTYVIVETSRGIECGKTVVANTEVEDNDITEPLQNVLRIATPADLQVVKDNQQRAQDAYQICKEKIKVHALDMHLVDVECTFDLNKILFYFTADGRVDFRDLVKDLAGIFHTRIELRQIGVRDEAKMIGGLGACGRELCCASYMAEFQPVSINMAKDQNLSLNPAKISGTCGRLMCCLKYEHEVYAEMQKATPKQGSYVETPLGNGTIVSVQMLRGLCKVQIEDSPDAPKEFACADCRVIRNAKGKNNSRAGGAGQAEDGKQEERAPRERSMKQNAVSSAEPELLQKKNTEFRANDSAEGTRKRSHRGGKKRTNTRKQDNTASAEES